VLESIALVIIPLYVANFLVFVQDIEDQVVYGLIGIIYGPISYYLFLFWHCLFYLDLSLESPSLLNFCSIITFFHINTMYLQK